MSRRSANTRYQYIDPAQPVDWDHPLTRGIVGWWMGLNQPGFKGSNLLRDLTKPGHGGNHLTLTNVTSQPWGEWGFQGCQFNGTTTYLIGANATTLGTQFTYCATYVPAALPTASTIVGWTTDGGPQFRIESTGALRFVKMNLADIGSGTAGAVVTNRTQRLVGSYNSSSGRFNFWVNGVPAGSGTNAQTLVMSTFNIGRNGGSSIGEYANGLLSSLIVINNRYFTDTDAELDFTLTRGGYRTPDSPLRWISSKTYFVPTTTTNRRRRLICGGQTYEPIETVNGTNSHCRPGS